MQVTGQKMGVGAYTDKSFVCITQAYVNHMITRRGVGLTRRWALTQENTVFAVKMYVSTKATYMYVNTDKLMIHY